MELITGGILVVVGVGLGFAGYHWAFKSGANTVWRAVDDGSRPELFSEDDTDEIAASTEEMDEITEDEMEP